MNYTAPNEKHKADFPSSPLIFTVNSSLPVDHLWEQVEPTQVQLLADLQEEIYIDGDPCGTGSARYLQYDVQRVHQYEGKKDSKEVLLFILQLEAFIHYFFYLLLLFVFLLFSMIIDGCQ